MDNEELFEEATTSLEAAIEAWDDGDAEMDGLQFRLREAQVWALLSIAQSLAMLARLADDELKARCFGPGEGD